VTVAVVLATLGALVLVGCGGPLPTPTRLPTPGPAPGPPPGFKPVVVQRGPTPTPVAGSQAPRSTKVKMRRDYWLLEAPRPDAQRLPIGLVGVGPAWDAKEEASGWVRIDAGPFTGWAPVDAVEFQP
jgi:hypothetical protein